MIDYLTQIKYLLKQYHLNPRKNLGQYFLIDESIVGKMIDAAELSSDDVVLEIGPGLGIPLTHKICEKAGKVQAVEIDEKMIQILKKTCEKFKNLEIVNEDILKINLKQRTKNREQKFKVISSLPYYITSPVLRKFLEAEKKPDLMVLLVQKEIAEKITASPPDMSILAVSVQFYAKPEIIDYVPREKFWPVPGVDSAIIKIKMPPVPEQNSVRDRAEVASVAEVKDVKLFFRIVKAGFSKRRKQLKNSLAGGLQINQKQVMELLKKSKIDPIRRAETLTMEEWIKLYKNVDKS